MTTGISATSRSDRLERVILWPTLASSSAIGRPGVTAIATLSRYSFDVLGLKKLSASMYAPNVGSYHAFRKAGYRQEGYRRSHYMLEGELCDVIEFGLCPEDLT
jgi:hypothetical protein